MGWKFLGTGDFTGSGTDDILFQNTNGQVLYWNMQNGAYNGLVGVAGASSDWSYVGAGDFTGNGTDDILFQNTNGQLLYWQMSGGSYAGSMALPAASAGWKVLGTGDFYGNGVSDILFQNANSGLLLDWQISTTGNCTSRPWHLARPAQTRSLLPSAIIPGTAQTTSCFRIRPTAR